MSTTLQAPGNLLTGTEVAAVLGCTRQNVSKMAQAAEAGVSRSGFPAPAIRFAAGALWSRADVERFAEERARRNGAQDAH